MDVKEAILTRRSIRAFKSKPVPQEILQEIIRVAAWSPSGYRSSNSAGLIPRMAGRKRKPCVTLVCRAKSRLWPVVGPRIGASKLTRRWPAARIACIRILPHPHTCGICRATFRNRK